MRDDLPRGTVTFLFTDVEGSTKLLHELGAEAYAEALAEHRRVIREACAAQQGVEVDNQGDACFFAFPTAPGALTAAKGITEVLASGPIQVRVGLHTGTPLLTDEGYVGADVHRAARIAAAGYGGQIVVSASTASLASPAGLLDLGEHRFKDLSAAERVYQLGDADFPPLRSFYRTNLPVPTTAFLGRERELAEIVALLSRDDVRLLTLTGPGGTGKTRLALQAAAEVSDAYPEGVWWVALAPLRDPRLVLEQAAHALGSTEQLASHIGERRMLILFDNLEHLLVASPDIAALISACPRLDVLGTSRELLQLRAEHAYPVPTLAEEDGVTLFRARALAAAGEVSEDRTIGELCRRLDNLPLAIELAAARTRHLAPDSLLERLSQRLELLTGSRDADPRQQTLRATIEWSHDLLQDAEQRLFARLAVFAGGCTFEAAVEVCDTDLDTLGALVDKSLVRRTGDRFWMLATIREFAVEKLQLSGEDDDLRARHSRLYVDLVGEASVGLDGPSEGVWLKQLLAELDNLRATRSWLIDTGQSEEELRLATAAYGFWYLRGLVSEGLDWLESALERHRERSELRARAVHSLASLSFRAANFDVARDRCQRALDLSRELGYADGVIKSLNLLSVLAVEQENFPVAESLLREAAAISRELDNSAALAYTTHHLGYIAWLAGNHQLATELHQEALLHNEAIGNQSGVALNLENLGGSALLSGDDDRALALLRAALRRFDDLGYASEISFCLDGIAAVFATRADADRAARLLGAAESLRKELSIGMDFGDRRVHELAVERTRVNLPPERLAALSFDGETMELQAALALALTDGD